MATVTFFIRTSKKTDPTKKINVRVRFRHGKEIDINAKSGLEVLPHYFSNDTHTISKQARYDDRYNDKQYLDNLEAVILSEFKNLKKPPTSDWLNKVIDKYRFPGKKTDKYTLFKFVEQFIREAPTTPRRINDELPSKKTITDYKVTFENLKEFANYKRKNDYLFNEIDIVFYTDFKNFLTVNKGYALNTVGKKIKVLKTFLNEAEYRGYISKDNFRHFKKLSEEKEAVYLSIDELDKIANLNLTNKPKLDRVRDLFLVGSWTGLRFSDWSKVKPENIDGKGNLNILQSKTGNSVTVPVHSTVKTILDKYDGNLPKPVSNQNFNSYLKEVVRLAGLKDIISYRKTIAGKKETIFKPKYELVTTHTARRSFATNAYNMGIPSITIMAITGHKTETSFLKYIKISKEQHARKMQEIWLSSGSYLKIAR